MSKWARILLAVIFALALIAMRAETHIPNMIPVGAFALWAGAYLKKRFAMPLICGLLIVGDAGDLIAGRYAWWLAAAVYASMLVYVLFGATLARYMPDGWRKLGGSFIAVCAGSFVYFATTNGAVWLFSALTGTGWYPKTITGFETCMIAGIPFWRNDLLVNTGGAVICFGVSALVIAVSRTKKTATAWQAQTESR
jgi:hypothetical protein